MVQCWNALCLPDLSHRFLYLSFRFFAYTDQVLKSLHTSIAATEVLTASVHGFHLHYIMQGNLDDGISGANGCWFCPVRDNMYMVSIHIQCTIAFSPEILVVRLQSGQNPHLVLT